MKALVLAHIAQVRRDQRQPPRAEVARRVRDQSELQKDAIGAMQRAGYRDLAVAQIAMNADVALPIGESSHFELEALVTGRREAIGERLVAWTGQDQMGHGPLLFGINAMAKLSHSTCSCR